MRFCVCLCRKLAVRAARQLNEPILERAREIANVAPVANYGHVEIRGRIRVARRRRLLCLGNNGCHKQGE